MSADFLDAFVEVCSAGTEVPEDFALWTGLAAAGAGLGRKVVINRGHFKLYPNLYVVLVGPAGGRKSTSLGILQAVLAGLAGAPNLTSQGGSPQGLIADLATVRAEGTNLTRAAQGMGVYSELGTFLNSTAHKLGMAELLCDLYDCKLSHKYRTVGSISEHLENIFFSFVGASTETSLVEALQPRNIGDGLTSRIIFVHVPYRREPVPFPPDKSAAIERARHLFNHLAKLRGDVILSPEARELFEDEYHDAYKNHPSRTDEILGAYLGRRDSHLIKVATILSAVRDDTLTISGPRMQEAIDLLKSVERGMPAVMARIGSNDEGRKVNQIREIIRMSRTIARSDLTKRVWRTLSAGELDGVLETLKDAGEVEEIVGGKRSTRTYIWRGDKGGNK